MDKQDLIALAKEKAEKYGLDSSLVCAIVEQESNWNTWAIRYEPGFYEHYVAPMNLGKTEGSARSTSWGLGQVMGEVAREMGFGGPFLSELCDPETGLEFLCKKFSSCMGSVGNNEAAALQRYNGGGDPNYSSEVLARVASYTISPPSPHN